MTSGTPFRSIRQASLVPRSGAPFRFTRAAPVRAGNGRVRVKQINADSPLAVPSYTVAGLPAALYLTGRVVFVSDESGGAVMAFSDGIDWRRWTDRVIVS